MTVEVETPTVEYGYGGPEDYPFSYSAPSTADIKVKYSDNGKITTLTPITDYTVETSPGIKGGNVALLYDVEIVSGAIITIYRDTDIDQQTDLINNDPLDMDVLERAYDKITMILQEQGVDFNAHYNRFIYRGDWSADITYFVNDVVTYPDIKGDWYGSKMEHDSTVAPDVDTTNWEIILDLSQVYQDVLAAAASATAAAASAAEALAYSEKAEDWSDNAANDPVETGRYSAMHWAIQAQLYAISNGIVWLEPWSAGTYPIGTMVNYGAETLITNKETSATPVSTDPDWDLVAQSASSPDVLEAPEDSEYYARIDAGWANIKDLLKTIVNKYTIVAKSADFEPAVGDADFNPLYEVDSSSAAIEITIASMTDSGFAAGDVITFEDVGDGSYDTTFVGDIGVTLNVPDLKAKTIRGKNSVVSIRYKSNTFATMYGDMRNA